MKDLCRAIEIADLEELLHRLPKVWDSPLGPKVVRCQAVSDSVSLCSRRPSKPLRTPA